VTTRAPIRHQQAEGGCADCGQPTHARGLCAHCYKYRWRRRTGRVTDQRRWGGCDLGENCQGHGVLVCKVCDRPYVEHRVTEWHR
jgi:hypothetical protein